MAQDAPRKEPRQDESTDPFWPPPPPRLKGELVGLSVFCPRTRDDPDQDGAGHASPNWLPDNGAWDGVGLIHNPERAHNPKVAGSNPAPATNIWPQCPAEAPGQGVLRPDHFEPPVRQEPHALELPADRLTGGLAGRLAHDSLVLGEGGLDVRGRWPGRQSEGFARRPLSLELGEPGLVLANPSGD